MSAAVRSGPPGRGLVIAALFVVAIGILWVAASGDGALPGTGADAGDQTLATAAPKVLVLGDSLVSQARDRMTGVLEARGWDVEVDAFPGLALCDLMGRFDEHAAADPRLVVVALNGNMGLGTGCSDGRGPQEEVYAADMAETAAYWKRRGVPVLWVDAPATVPAAGEPPLVALEQTVARDHGQQFARTTDALRAPDGSWPFRIPCTERERTRGRCDPDGLVQARQSEDNGHPCPVEYEGFGSCPVYSAGIDRWVRAIAGAAEPFRA